MTISSAVTKKNSLEKHCEMLEPLVEDLKKSSSIEERLKVLNAFLYAKEFLVHNHSKLSFFFSISQEYELIIKSVVAIGQERIFQYPQGQSNVSEMLKTCLECLIPVEKFYREVGGIVGYHYLTIKCILDAQQKKEMPLGVYHQPDGIDISEETKEVREAILSGIARLGEIAEIYPVGGAADRLRLHDEKTGIALPAARLLFGGKTLLERMIEDLQSREYLHYKLFRRQILTPIAMMTSREKDNHFQILSICEEKEWFGRPRGQFYFFCQPLVPAMNRQGQWCLLSPMQLLLKPGGHGVIWKLARDQGVFEWLFENGRKKALIRQINNPIANTDHGLLSFTGFGCQKDKVFGFASCPRQVKATEGINVIIEIPKAEKYEYVLTNIEYCDFKKYQIEDEPAHLDSFYSKFPSNTNILFADLQAVLRVISQNPLPGMLSNLKKTAYRTPSGKIKEEEVTRLESTMQNIADFFAEEFSSSLSHSIGHQLKTFLTYNHRKKTISAVKREFVLGASLLETPEGCFLDVLANSRDLLSERCGMKLPQLHDASTFFIRGPSFIFTYHPCLGPLYSIIAQKIRGGCIHTGSELQLEIAEIDMENLNLSGSLQIKANAVMGHKNSSGVLEYSELSGKCTLKNVTVCNEGIDREAANVFWKNEIYHKECCTILIHGNGEFYAENICLEGHLTIEVESGTKVIALEKEGKLHFHREALTAPSWHWQYEIAEDFYILLKKNVPVSFPDLKKSS